MNEPRLNATSGYVPLKLEPGDPGLAAVRNPDPSARREFIRLTALAAGVAGLVRQTTARASEQPAADRNPDAVLAGLIEGNKRFVSGRLIHPGRKPEDFAALAEGQAPLAAIIGCADSRVAPELIFDQGVGDLFVVRIAGNIVDGAGPSVKGSIEFAVAELGVRLIIVLGHGQCGAVKAAIQHIDANDSLPGSIGDLIDPIRAAVIAAKGQPGDKLENVIKANVERGVKRLETLDPILSKAIKSGGLKVVGAVYDLRTGLVKVCD